MPSGAPSPAAASAGPGSGTPGSPPGVDGAPCLHSGGCSLNLGLSAGRDFRVSGPGLTL